MNLHEYIDLSTVVISPDAAVGMTYRFNLDEGYYLAERQVTLDKNQAELPKGIDRVHIASDLEEGVVVPYSVAVETRSPFINSVMMLADVGVSFSPPERAMIYHAVSQAEGTILLCTLQRIGDSVHVVSAHGGVIATVENDTFELNQDDRFNQVYRWGRLKQFHPELPIYCKFDRVRIGGRVCLRVTYEIEVKMDDGTIPIVLDGLFPPYTPDELSGLQQNMLTIVNAKNLSTVKKASDIAGQFALYNLPLSFPPYDDALLV